jgi:hypothetical protein
VSLCVVFTVNDRPHYLEETLESWRKVRGIEKASLIFRCEPGCEEAVRVCEAVNWAQRVVLVNPQRYGVAGNPWRCFEMAFNGIGHDFAILAEEDIVVATDTLEYFRWCAETYRWGNVLGVTTYQPEPVAPPDHVVQADWSEDEYWHFWVWGTWRDRWNTVLRHTWDHDYSNNGWDWNIRDNLVLGKGMVMASPGVPRSQHIGQFGGTHSPPDDYLFRMLQAEGYEAEHPRYAYSSQF